MSVTALPPASHGTVVPLTVRIAAVRRVLACWIDRLAAPAVV